MKCSIESLHMNVRYRVLHIGNESFILDMGGSSLWKVIFPLLYWMFPLDVYKVDDDEVIDKIVSPSTEQQGVGLPALFGAAISLTLGNLIYPFVDLLDIEITSMTSAIITILIFLLILAFFFYSNKLLGRKLQQHINLEEFPKEKLLVRPVSKKYFIQLFLYYLFAIAACVVVIAAVIQIPNGFMFFAASIIFFMTLGISFVTVRPGETTVRFKNSTVTE